MLLEDKELRKSIPLQLKRGRGRAFAKRNQKINSKNQSSKTITRGCGSKITLRNKTLRLHFQISDSTFFLSLSHFERGPKVLFPTLHHASLTGGKTERSMSRYNFPKNFSLGANRKHFSNTNESLKLIDEIIAPHPIRAHSCNSKLITLHC